MTLTEVSRPVKPHAGYEFAVTVSWPKPFNTGCKREVRPVRPVRSRGASWCVMGACSAETAAAPRDRRAINFILPWGDYEVTRKTTGSKIGHERICV